MERALAERGEGAPAASQVLLSAIDAFAAVLDTDGTVLEATAAALRLGGIERGETIGRRLWDLPVWHSPEDADAVLALVTEAAEGRSACHVVHFQPEHSEGPRAVELVVRPVRGTDGHVAFLLAEQDQRSRRGRAAAVRPPSTRDAVARQLHRLGEMRQRLVADISHDMRAPLLSIAARAERMLNHPDESVRIDASDTRADALAALKQLEELADLAGSQHRRTQLRIATVDLAGAARSIARRFAPIAARRDVTLTVDAPEVMHSHADPDKVTSILSNLVANALRYTPIGGRVRVSIRAEGEDVVLEVADSGPGIPEAHRASVFRRTWRAPGARRRTDGSGLGLAIVREAVDLHRGTIGVGAAPEGGALMHVRLPRDPSFAVHAGPRTLREEASARLTTELAVAELQRRLEHDRPGPAPR